jgi:hypothetical protein
VCAERWKRGGPWAQIRTREWMCGRDVRWQEEVRSTNGERCVVRNENVRPFAIIRLGPLFLSKCARAMAARALLEGFLLAPCAADALLAMRGRAGVPFPIVCAGAALASPPLALLVLVGGWLLWLPFGGLFALLSSLVGAWVVLCISAVVVVLLGRLVAQALIFPPTIGALAASMHRDSASRYHRRLQQSLSQATAALLRQAADSPDSDIAARAQDAPPSPSRAFLLAAVETWGEQQREAEEELLAAALEGESSPALPASPSSAAHASVLRHYISLSLSLLDACDSALRTDAAAKASGQGGSRAVVVSVGQGDGNNSSSSGAGAASPHPSLLSLSSASDSSLLFSSNPPYVPVGATRAALAALPSQLPLHEARSLALACLRRAACVGVWAEVTPHEGLGATRAVRDVGSLAKRSGGETRAALHSLREGRKRRWAAAALRVVSLGFVGGSGGAGPSRVPLPTAPSSSSSSSSAPILGLSDDLVGAASRSLLSSSASGAVPVRVPKRRKAEPACECGHSHGDEEDVEEEGADVEVSDDEEGEVEPESSSSAARPTPAAGTAPSPSPVSVDGALRQLQNSSVVGRAASLLSSISSSVWAALTAHATPEAACGPSFFRAEAVVHGGAIQAWVRTDDGAWIDVLFFPADASTSGGSPRVGREEEGAPNADVDVDSARFTVAPTNRRVQTRRRLAGFAAGLQTAGVPGWVADCCTQDGTDADVDGDAAAAADESPSAAPRGDTAGLLPHRASSPAAALPLQALDFLLRAWRALPWPGRGGGFLSGPQSRRPRRRPGFRHPFTSQAPATVLYCNPNAGLAEYAWRGNDWVTRHTRMGFDVAIWSYRGYGRSGVGAGAGEGGASSSSPRPALLRSDGECVARWLRRDVRCAALILHGESLGGIAACHLAELGYGKVLLADRTMSTLPRTARRLVGAWAETALSVLTGWTRSNADAYALAPSSSPPVRKIIAVDSNDAVISWDASLAAEVGRRRIGTGGSSSSPFPSLPAPLVAEFDAVSSHLYFLLRHLSRLSVPLFSSSPSVATLLRPSSSGSVRGDSPSTSTASRPAPSDSASGDAEADALHAAAPALDMAALLPTGTPDGAALASVLVRERIRVHPRSVAFSELLSAIHGDLSTEDEAVLAAITLAVTSTCTQYEGRISELIGLGPQALRRATAMVRRDQDGAVGGAGEEPSPAPSPATLPAIGEASRKGLDLDAATFGETLPSLYGATSVLIALAGLTNGMGQRLGETAVEGAEGKGGFRTGLQSIRTFLAAGLEWGWAESGKVVRTAFVRRVDPAAGATHASATSACQSPPSRMSPHLLIAGETGAETTLRRLLSISENIEARNRQGECGGAAPSQPSDAPSSPPSTSLLVPNARPMDIRMLAEATSVVRRLVDLGRAVAEAHGSGVRDGDERALLSLRLRACMESPQGFVLPLGCGHNNSLLEGETDLLEAALRAGIQE